MASANGYGDGRESSCCCGFRKASTCQKPQGLMKTPKLHSNRKHKSEDVEGKSNPPWLSFSYYTFTTQITSYTKQAIISAVDTMRMSFSLIQFWYCLPGNCVRCHKWSTESKDCNPSHFRCQSQAWLVYICFWLTSHKFGFLQPLPHVWLICSSSSRCWGNL